MNLWYGFVAAVLPFSWAKYDFMKNALLAALLIGPSFGVLSTMVISSRLAFFSDVIGHSALTGVAIGILFGMVDPLPAMVGFAVVLAIGITLFRHWTQAASDTVLGVFFAGVVAFGIAILTRSGGFAKFTNYLIGDILSIGPKEIGFLALTFVLVFVYWGAAGNSLILSTMNTSLARSRGIRVMVLEASFASLIAVVVTLSIQWLGVLIINSLLILPAAAARIPARTVRAYTAWSASISLFSCVTGLIVSFYLDSSAGATIVLVAAACYMILALASVFMKKRQ
jgi:zinc transport system permease protein